MKKFTFPAIFFILSQISAQDFQSSADSLKSSQQKPTELKNIVKTNITAYAFRNINLTYERVFAKWFSATIGYSTMPDGKIPFLKSILSEEDYQELGDLSASSSAFTLEARFYLGKGYGKGFYVAPYYRNSSFGAKGFNYKYEYEYYEENEGNSQLIQEEIPLLTSGSTKANSFGLLIGSQFFLNKKGSWILDWWIGGGHYGAGSGNFDMVSNRSLTPDQQNALKADLEDLDIPLLKYEVTTTTNGAKIKIDGPWAGLRSGLSLGYRF